MIRPEDFPRLTPSNHRITSPETEDYNCIALAAEDMSRWWEPGIHWLPADASGNDFSPRVLEMVFLLLGYENCGMDISLELGFQKVARYAKEDEYTHAARQLASGKWLSKLGKSVDIEHHSPHDVAGGVYGDVAGIMRRRIASG